MDDRVILVMPLLRWYDDPPFQTIGEAVDLFSQLFEVCPCLRLFCVFADSYLRALSSYTGITSLIGEFFLRLPRL